MVLKNLILKCRCDVGAVLLLVFLCQSTGCASRTWRLSDLDITEVTVTVESLTGNEEALRYGFQLQDGSFTNDLLIMRGTYAPGGYVFVIENLTEYPIRLNWTHCLLVDTDRWTHNIIHPDAVGSKEVWLPTQVLIAPAAKRIVTLIAQTARAFQFNRPTYDQPFRPTRASVPPGGFTERVVLDMDFRGKTLIYDLNMRISPRGSAE